MSVDATKTYTQQNEFLLKNVNFRLNPLRAFIAGISTGLHFLGLSSLYAQEVTQTQPPAEIEETFIVGIRKIQADNLNAVHDLPFSQSIISGAILDRELGLDYEAISKRLANVTFNQSNTRGASLSVRGLGKRAFAEVQDPSVLVVQDGVSFGLTALGNFDFYDIEAVEGFRGPQGTLGGKGGSSGAVYVRTRRPTFEESTELSIAYGERDSVVAKGAKGGPLIDDLLAWRGAFVVDKQPGYYANRFNDNHTFYNRNRVSGRVQFLLTPTPDLTARLSVDVEPKAAQLQNGLTFYHDQPLRFANGSLTDPSGTTAKAKFYGFETNSGAWTPARSWFVGRDFDNDIYTYDDYIAGGAREQAYINEVQGQTVHNNGSSLEINYALANHTLSSITAWRSYSFDARNDEGTPFDISTDGGGGVNYDQYSQEFSIKAEGDVFDYVAGLLFFKTDNTINSKAGWGSDAGAWFATSAQYNVLDTGAGINRASGLALLKDSLDNARRQGDTNVQTLSNAIYGNANWHWHDAATLTVGLRIGSEDRTTEDYVTLDNYGAGGALNPVSVRGYTLGGFSNVESGNRRGELGTLDGGGNVIDNNSLAQKQLADLVANKYYGAAILDGSPGAAYDSLTAAQKIQIASAKALRASQIGQLIPRVENTYEDTLYTTFVSQNYRFNDQITGYANWQYGEKSGTAYNINGESAEVKPEKTNAFEIGLKTFWLDDTLTLNADIFVMDVKDYQQAIRTVDEWATNDNIANGIANPTAYVTSQGNVNRVKVEGLELDGVYTGIEHLSVRFSGAYNDAYYQDFKNSPKPAELNYLTEAFVDQSGKNLPGASKWTFNLGAEYRIPVFGKAEFHTSFNTAYSSDNLSADDLSAYSYFPSSSRTDVSIGLGAQDGTFDVSLIVKNAFDDRTHEEGWASYAPWPYPRWLGVVYTGKF